MMKILIVLLVCVIGLGAWWFFADRGPDTLTPQVIVAFGDSLVSGVGAPEGDGFVSVLESRLGMPIVNAGRSGDTTASALVRVERDVLSLDPGTVIVLLGGNDALRQAPREETFANLGRIIDLLEAKGVRILLLGVRGSALGDTYRASFDALAKEKDVSYVPDVLAGIITDPRLMADTVHPNMEGYRKIADKVEGELRELLSR